ncbi:hypothetical protein [Thalassolituus sp.]|jgi:hypothetical protein|uniref:hypothetical protein n=1 Tax=Thalassolituus sp. TaxID=2030822 RepID=UPI0032D9106B
MSNTLTDIAKKLSTPISTQKQAKAKGRKNNTKVWVKSEKPIPKVQLIYAFNGSGKTRLSREFKEIVAPKSKVEDGNDVELSRSKILYYNAFTEDLFYWDNDLDDDDKEPKLKIQKNSFTGWLIELLQELGEDDNIVTNFQRYTGSKATPVFNNEAYKQKIKEYNGNEVEVTTPIYSEVTFRVAANRPIEYQSSNAVISDENSVIQGQYDRIKVSKGEESNFVWSVIYTLLEQVISTLNEPDTTNRLTDKFNALEYVFIDDPVSSLDDSHLIELAVDLAELIKSSRSDLKFVITTHSPLFYNVLFNDLSRKAYQKNADDENELIYNPDKDFKKYRLVKLEDGYFDLLEQPKDSSFSYHLFLLSELQIAIKSGKVRKYHFSFVRNILEKMAIFLGFNDWGALLPKTSGGKPDPLILRILNLSSHSAHAGEEVAETEHKEKLEELVKYLIKTYGFSNQG